MPLSLRPTSFKRSLTVGLFCGLALASSALAQSPAVAGYGKFTALPQAHEQPVASTDYKVVFDISEGAKAPDQVNPGLDRAARLVNMLAAGGVAPSKRHIVTVVHGAATDTMVSDTVYAARHGGQKNPNTPLIAALQAAGVSVRICGQAMTGQKIAQTDLAPGVQLDLAALMTVTNLQFQGYAYVAD